jgi:selenocysteine-specific elongation factor
VIQRNFVIATAGHVDHGKSALVKALTGTDPDRLPEEKAREITIDLGFAHLELPAPVPNAGGETAALSISIVDVPGHGDFVRNMIAGVGSIDLALLVVAADDGWMPQTEEHLQILSYLAVERMVVAVNKSDVVRPERAMAQIQEQLGTTAFRNAPIVPISARTGLGLDQLKATLVSVLEDTMPQPDVGKPRLFIDRAFHLAGIGAVVTGTLSGGVISSGQQVFLQPGNFRTRARALQTHRTNVSLAKPGMRVGINLVELPKTASDHDLRRGYVLTADEFEATSVLDVVIEKSARLQGSVSAGRPLKSGTSVYVQYGTGRIPAIVVWSDRGALQTGERAIGQLRLATPVMAFIGDRFVIRDRSEQHTIAGGLILDPNGDPRSFRTVTQQKLLHMRRTNPHDAGVCIESELIRRSPVRLSTLLRNSNFSAVEIGTALAALQQSGRVVVHGDITTDSASWEVLKQRAIDLIDRAHKAKSEQKGLDLTELRAGLPELSSEAAEALISDLCTTGFVRRGSIIARVSHHPTLPAGLDRSAKQLRAALAEKPFDPPARMRIAPDADRQQAARYLIDSGEVVDLGPDLLLSAEAFDQAKQMIVQFITTRGSATVSELREALQTSRRVAVPLLERLDRDRITQRSGDHRQLVQPKSVVSSTV